jgi:hypothetical protein
VDARWKRAAARDRDQRFDSAKDLADALGEALGMPRPIVVPSVAPRRVSLTEIDPLLAAQDGRETDAPLTNTRHSSIPPGRRGFLSRIRSRFITSRMWVRRVPRRHVAMAAVVSGIAAGAALTLGMTEMRSSKTTAASPVTPAEVTETSRPAPVPTPTVYVEELAPLPTPSADPSAEAAASAAPSASAPAPSGKVASPARPSSRVTPAARTPPKKAAAKGRDYGI